MFKSLRGIRSLGALGMKCKFHIIINIIILSVLITSLAIGEGIKASPTLSSRKVIIVNPSPFNKLTYAYVNVSFVPGEAYNSSIYVYNSFGEELPFQVINACFYPSSPYYKYCILKLLLPLKAWSHENITVTFTSEPRTPTFFNTDLVVYTDNVTGNLIVKNDFYKVVFGNVSLQGVQEFLIKSNKGYVSVLIRWPFIGFSVLLKNGTIITPLSYANLTYRVVRKGPLEVVIRLNATSYFMNITQTYTFSAYSPVIYVHSKLFLRDYSEVLTAYLPVFHIPTGIFDIIWTSLNTSENLVKVSMKSFRPAPTWFLLFSSKGNYGMAYYYNQTLMNFKSALAKILYNLTYTKKRSLIFEIYRKRSLSILGNVSFLMNPSYYIGKGIKEVKDVIWSLGYLANNTEYYEDILFANITQKMSSIYSNVSKRLVFFKEEGYLNLAYQLNETQLRSNVIQLDSSLIVYPYLNLTKNFTRNIWKDVIKEMITPVSILTPLAISINAPNQVFTDEIFNVTARIIVLEDLAKLNVSLMLPKGVRIFSDINTYNFTNVRQGSEVDVSWSLVPFYEGNYTLNLLASSERGDIVISKPISIIFYPVFPKVSLLYNLTVLCKDQEGRPIPHIMVKVYDNRTGALVGYNVTDINGTATFYNLKLGTYKVVASDGIISNKTIVLLYRNTVSLIVLGKASFALSVFSSGGYPMEGVAVYIYDVNGTLVFMGYTDKHGYFEKRGLPLGNYTISLRWFDVTLDYFSLNLTRDINMSLTLHVHKLVINVMLSDGRVLPGAKVSISLEMERRGTPRVIAYTDEYGRVTLLLPRSRYIIEVEKGQYRGRASVFLDRDTVIDIVCSTINTLWILVGSAGGLWAFTALYWQRVTRVTYREERKYQQLLRRLEEFYRKGLIEEKYYLRLKSEYEEKLKKLRGERS